MAAQTTRTVVQSNSTLNIDPALFPAWDITAAVASVGIVLKASKFPDPNAVLTFTAILRQDGAGSRSFAWGSNVHWAGSVPQPTATPILVRLYSLDQGVTWYEATT